MSHEQSVTDQNPYTGRWVNRVGPKGEKPGKQLGRDYESQREAETAAIYRSFNEGRRHQYAEPESHMPDGGQLSPIGDLGELRQLEALKVFPALQKMTDHVKRSSRRIPVKEKFGT